MSHEDLYPTPEPRKKVSSGAGAALEAVGCGMFVFLMGAGLALVIWAIRS